MLCPQAVESNDDRRHRGRRRGRGRRHARRPRTWPRRWSTGWPERFLILPHPEVLEYFRRKADDYERWLRGMRRLQARFGAQM